MTSSRASLIILLIFATLLEPLALHAGVLSAQEQGLANLLVNAVAQQRNRGGMRLDATLTTIARSKARDMAVRGYFAHVSPEGYGPNYKIRAAGFPLPLWWGTARSDNSVESQSAGYSDASEAWSALMDSPAHRNHLLATDSFYMDQTSYGIGYYADEDSPYLYYFVIITAPPRAKSTLTISSPSSGLKVNSERITATGTVGGSDNVSVLDIRVENSAGASPWTRVSLPGGSGIGNWSANLTGLLPGYNTIRTRSYQQAGNLLAEASRTVRWVVVRPLTVAVQGPGKVTNGFLGVTDREVGVRYTITATPTDDSSIFSDWLGLPSGMDVNSAKQSLTMVVGLSLVAHFVPNPFWTRSGVYSGVLQGQQSFTRGALNIRVGPTGAFSGKLYYGNGAYSIRGRMNASGQVSLQLNRRGGNEIGLSFALDVSGNSDQITGSVNEFGMITALTADRRAETGQSIQEGQFTLKIAPDAVLSASPRGNGFAIASITTNGTVKIVGTLADGHSFSTRSIVSKNGRIPIYSRVYSENAGIMGAVNLVNTTLSDIDGTLRYFKPERPKDQYYPEAFMTVNPVSGSRYIRPLKGQPLINFQTAENRGRLLLSQGNIGNQISQQLEVESDNTVALAIPTYTGLKVSVNPKNGRFSGSFLHPIAGVRRFSGVVTQKQRAGWGFFLGVDQSGATQLQPQP